MPPTQLDLLGLGPEPSLDGITRGAELSTDGRHRWRLTRSWSPGPCAVWIMLNPSTADALRDDHTIRCCTRFSRREGAGSLLVVNLYPYRSTEPAALGAIGRALATGGDRGLQVVAEAIADADGPVIAAWGTRSGTGLSSAEWRARTEAVAAAAAAIDVPLWCLGVTVDGSPRHPSRLPVDAPLARWPA